MRTRAHILLPALLSLSLATIPAFALPGEASAVLEQCGAPTSQSSNIRPTDSFDERTLTYGDLTLHFEPMQGRWSFTSAWRGETNLSRTQLAAQMPCFHKALDEAAAEPTYGLPTLAAETQVGPFGIPHFFFIAFLLLALFAIAIWPRRRAEERDPVPADRPYRRPTVQRRSRNLNDSVRH